jgi:hypothetical protein
MLFIVIVLLILATYFLIKSDVFKNWINPTSDVDAISTMLEPGSLGSMPDDSIDVYDSKKIINIPMEGAINTLIESFKSNSNKVYVDFKNNKNSNKYKQYIFDDYKLEILRKNEALTEEQLNKYFTIRNTIVKDINDLFTYHLDKIKYNVDKSYFMFRREILNSDGTKLLLTTSMADRISNYTISNTTIPSKIILLLKYKLNNNAQELLEQIIMQAGYNYTNVLETLEQLLIREPIPGITLLGIVNNESTYNVDGKPVISQGFWTLVYYAFKSNNINNYLIELLKLSFMKESTYRNIITVIISNMQNNKITDALNSIINMCKNSEFNIIKSFPYNFTHSLIYEAINDNRIMLRSKRVIDISQIDKSTDSISNIENYINIERNFPVSIQEIKIKVGNGTTEFDYTNPIYPILSDAYMTNNYLSFPNIKHRGVYFDRTNAIPSNNSGYIMITNTSKLSDLNISTIIIYGQLLDGFINDDYRSIDNNVSDKYILHNNAFITLETGTYDTSQITPAFINVESTTITTNWLTGLPIRIAPGTSVRIRATKQTSIISSRYLRIYSIFIPFLDKPLSDFLKISIIPDISQGDIKYNHYTFKNIPKPMPNILVTLDSTYNVTTSPIVFTDTFKVFQDNIAEDFNVVHFSGATGASLTGSVYTTYNKDNIFGSINPFTTGLITDTRLYNTVNPNSNRASYRIRFKNLSTDNVPILIKKMIIFGTTSSTSDSIIVPPQSMSLNSIITDENILYKNSIITAFTMNQQETEILESGVTNFIVDTIYQSINKDDSYLLTGGKSIYVEPIVSDTISLINRFVCVRAIYIEVEGTILSNLSISVIKLNVTGGNTIVTYMGTSTFNKGAALLLFTPFSGGLTYPSRSSFTILPKYTYDNFYNPSYYNDEYYDPISEITQYPSIYY